jgi:propanediol dehydratase large subunit
MNLELFSQAPLIGEADYRAIGGNAAQYALGKSPVPVTIPYRGQALGARFHVQTALLYAIETSMIEAGQNPEVLEVKFYDGR